MKTIEIQPPIVEIFDDPEYCGKMGFNARCKKATYNDNAFGCDQFGVILETRKMAIIKCDQCKEAWKKAKDKEEEHKEYLAEQDRKYPEVKESKVDLKEYIATARKIFEESQQQERE